MTTDASGPLTPHRISVVVPVYQGERTLPALVDEIAGLTTDQTSPGGRPFVVEEVILVHDHGPDDSARVIRSLTDAHPFVRGVWLSRNFGQHPATLAGMASSGGEWIVTMDEDGQHDPADIGVMLDAALDQQTSVVYGKPVNPPPHGWFRNATSRGAKWVLAKLLGSRDSQAYQSYRLVLGEIGRSAAAYVGSGVYLDVAMGWIAGRVGQAPITLRSEGDRTSGYRLRSLVSHFWRMVLSSGTKGLRLVSAVGAFAAVVGVLLALYLFVAWLAGHGATEPGWTSTMVVFLVGIGFTMFFLGIIAEYIGVSVNMAMGKPAYLIVSSPADGPMSRTGRRESP